MINRNQGKKETAYGYKSKSGIRRKKRQKRQLLAAFFTFCMIVIISFVVCGFSSNAKTETEDEVCKYYKSVMIEKGDTLWSIASQNMNSGDNDISSYIEEVMRMNGLQDDRITEGMYLVIPYFF